MFAIALEYIHLWCRIVAEEFASGFFVIVCVTGSQGSHHIRSCTIHRIQAEAADLPLLLAGTVAVDTASDQRYA